MPTEQQLANRKQWLAALRSGAYEQAKGSLCVIGSSGSSYCCLGLDAELAGELEEYTLSDGNKADVKRAKSPTLHNLTSFPRDAWFAERHGIPEDDTYDLTRKLACWNDYGEPGRNRLNFNQIADAIEHNFAKIDAGTYEGPTLPEAK